MSSGEQLYRIVAWENIFRTCRSNNGDQLLIGVQLPELVAVVFDRHGTFERITTRQLRSATAGPDDDRVASELDEMIRDLRFAASPIEVKRFFLDDFWIGIKAMPDHFEEVLEHPDHFDETQRAILRDEMAKWIARGDFVLYWCEEYYLNRDGEVESS